VPQEETQARLDLNQAKATLDLDESIVKARTQLFAQGAVPGRDVDTAKATALQAQAAYEIAKQKFDSINKVGREASLKTAQGQLESAKGKYLGAEAQLAYTSLRAPISGVVTDRPLFAGETAAAGTAILTIMDTSVLIAKLHLSQSQSQQLAPGGPATITVPGLDGPVAAKVSLVSPALDPGSTTVEVWLRVDNADGRLKAGTSVQAKIKGKTTSQALLIPVEAVQRSSDSGGKMVMVVSANGTAHKKDVSIGLETSEEAQVLDGLNLGDAVITEGGYGLDPGAKVKVEAVSAKSRPGDQK
jgi:RND family efflux transporter MFP subunit